MWPREIPIASACYMAMICVSIASCTLLQGQDYAQQTSYQRITGDSSSEPKLRWDALYSTERFVFGKEPSNFLVGVLHNLHVGLALDIAMGEGRNAIFLAKKGYRVEGVDFSEVALRKARRFAREQNVEANIKTINADLSNYTIQKNRYDLIINIDYLQKNLIPQMVTGLKSKGYIVFENYTLEQLKNPSGKGMSRDFLLKKGELKELFSDPKISGTLKIIKYEHTNDGRDARDHILVQKL